MLNFLDEFATWLFVFSIMALGIFFVERKEYLDTYTRVYRKLTGQQSFLEWIPKLIKYLLVAAGLALVVSAIIFAFESL